MGLKIGIVGLPNVGKSTLFKALTCNPVDISNYPFCTIEPNIGVVKVPDERLEQLAQMSHSRKIIPAVVEFVDIAGLVQGAAEGEGLGNKFLSHIREMDAIVQVVRVFPNEKIIHVYNKINPLRDIEIINAELILADLETVKKAEARLEKDIRGNKKGAAARQEIVKEIKNCLERGELASVCLKDKSLSDDNFKSVVQELSLLTFKPIIYVYNTSNPNEKLILELENKDHIKLDIKIEEELNEMSAEEAKELGIKSNLGRLVVKAYDILGLITYFTTGEDETRAWTIKKGFRAPEAGAVIHTDFQEKFIRAEVIDWKKLLEAGSWSKARELGWLRTEGKDYIVRDGDVIEFKI